MARPGGHDYRFFAKHGHYSPESGFSPEDQAEHPAENSLLTDHNEALRRIPHEMECLNESNSQVLLQRKA